jgi:uncharacterized protein DUF4169
VVEQKLFRKKIETQHLMLSRHYGEFHNGRRSGENASAEFGCGSFERHAFIDRPHRYDNDRSGVMGAGMGDLVNLKQFKKRAARDLSEQEAAANRARFGRTKSKRALDELQASRASNLLDQHRIDDEDAS